MLDKLSDSQRVGIAIFLVGIIIAAFIYSTIATNDIYHVVCSHKDVVILDTYAHRSRVGLYSNLDHGKFFRLPDTDSISCQVEELK